MLDDFKEIKLYKDINDANYSTDVIPIMITISKNKNGHFQVGGIHNLTENAGDDECEGMSF